jgi:Peptidase family M23
MLRSPIRWSVLAPFALAACAGAPPAPVEPKCPASPVLATPAASTAAEKVESGPLVDSVAKELVKRVGAKDGKAVFELLGPGMREVLPQDKVGPWVDGIYAAKGKLGVYERTAGKGNETTGVYRVKAERGDWHVELTASKEGTVLGLKWTDPAPPEPPVVKSTIALGLPFRGQWHVFWGGDKPDVNYHVQHKSQRRATDLVMVDQVGKTHRGDGKKNEDYLAYGQEVLAVADGEVVTAIDGVHDNVPGSLNPLFALGNGVIVKHGEALYSMYAHFQPGKVRVKAGTKVKRGAVLGLCGNSGNSSEPHLHFQLQDGPLVESSWGIEPVFKDIPVVRDGKAAKLPEYTWLKADLVGEPAKK